MHDTAYEIGRRVLEIYGTSHATIVEIGACNVNGALRDFCPEGANYIGLDIEAGPGVDYVVPLGKPLPLADNSADLVVSSSVLEHDACFWQTFLDLVRVAKPEGIIYFNAPSNGAYHRFPVDNWRFYPDCGHALVKWAEANGLALTLIESFVASRMNHQWNDFVAIFKKTPRVDPADVSFISANVRSRNIWRAGQQHILSESSLTEDMELLMIMRAERAKMLERVGELDALVRQRDMLVSVCDTLRKQQEQFIATLENLRNEYLGVASERDDLRNAKQGLLESLQATVQTRDMLEMEIKNLRVEHERLRSEHEKIAA